MLVRPGTLQSLIKLLILLLHVQVTRCYVLLLFRGRYAADRKLSFLLRWMSILGEFVGHELVVTITVLARLTLAIATNFGSLTVKATCNGFVLLFLRPSIEGS